MTDRKYYIAYDDRYRQIHEAGLSWAADIPSPIVRDILLRHFGQARPRILEIGCGEGRDAAFLLRQGYSVNATDVSPAAIRYCRERYPGFHDAFQVLDCLEGRHPQTYDFIYAVAVVHMLVEEEDRQKFYRFLRDHLAPNGIGLICTMGDGVVETRTDASRAFDLVPRVHQQTGKQMMLASTSCRMVSFDTFLAEIAQGGLTLVEQGMTSAADNFSHLMYAVVTRAAALTP